jgi:hypothetical protein
MTAKTPIMAASMSHTSRCEDLQSAGNPRMAFLHLSPQLNRNNESFSTKTRRPHQTARKWRMNMRDTDTRVGWKKVLEATLPLAGSLAAFLLMLAFH